VIEVLYLRGCPHADGLGDHIEQLVSQHGFHERVVTRCVDSNAQAGAEHFLGSPTVRVNGRDVDPRAGERHAYGLACRTPGVEGGTAPRVDSCRLKGNEGAPSVGSSIGHR
jgi:hypothetical protein